MILRDEINERVIITAANKDGWFSTDVYQLDDSGEMNLWLQRKDCVNEQCAIYNHEKYISSPEPIHKCKYCDEMALNYDGLLKEWLCKRHFNIYIRERV